MLQNAIGFLITHVCGQLPLQKIILSQELNIVLCILVTLFCILVSLFLRTHVKKGFCFFDRPCLYHLTVEKRTVNELLVSTLLWPILLLNYFFIIVLQIHLIVSANVDGYSMAPIRHDTCSRMIEIVCWFVLGNFWFDSYMEIHKYLAYALGPQRLGNLSLYWLGNVREFGSGNVKEFVFWFLVRTLLWMIGVVSL